MAKSAAQKKLEQATKNLGKTSSFSYNNKNGYQTAWNKANNAYNNWLENPSANGLNKYIGDVDELFASIMNQEKFSYDPQRDQLFQMYKQQYQNQGIRAMNNQMGVAAAATGGYNSSVGQTSAQNTYQTYMNELSNKAAETYQNALDMHKYKQQNLLDKYNVASDMNNASNEQYWQQTNALGQKAQNAYNIFNDDRSFQYNKFSDNRGFWQNQQTAAQNQVNWEKEFKRK